MLINASRNTETHRLWTPDFLHQEAGGVKILASDPYSNAQTGANRRAQPQTTLSEYLDTMASADAAQMSDDEREYLFDRYHFFDNTPSLKAAFATPTFVDYDSEFILALGSKGTGIPLHFHTDSWLEVVAGSKQWWVYPPGTPVPFCSSLSQVRHIARESRVAPHPIHRTARVRPSASPPIHALSNSAPEHVGRQPRA